jgi:N-acetyl-anhydromuramyl-L-alanine amidase AmpD
MALKEMAAIVVRPRTALWVGATLITAGAISGCGHSRTSYRPVYTTPATVATPCKNCGTSAAVTTEDSGLPPVTSVPSSSEPSMLDSTTTTTMPPTRSGSGTVKSRVEPQAKSRLGEPPFDETSSSRDDTSTPPPPPKPLGSGPAVQGPTTLLSPTSDWGNGSDTPSATAGTSSKLVRRASLSEQLKPFLDDSNANELIYPNKADRPWRYVVLHHSAAASGSYDQIDAEHRKILGIDGCGYHFVIGNGNGSGDGQIEVAQRWANQKQGIHCRNARTHDVDEYGIGICLVGDIDKEPPTPRQIAAAKALVAHLSTRYNITQARVQTHAHLAATKTVCPGRHFPNEEILALSKEPQQQARRPVRAAWKVVREVKPSY